MLKVAAGLKGDMRGIAGELERGPEEEKGGGGGVLVGVLLGEESAMAEKEMLKGEEGVKDIGEEAPPARGTMGDPAGETARAEGRLFLFWWYAGTPGDFPYVDAWMRKSCWPL